MAGGHANQIGGAIRDKWADFGYERGAVKFPTSRELAARKPGRFNRFENGNIYWSSATGAHPVYGEIFKTYSAADWEAGRYGFPATDQSDCQGAGKKSGEYGGFAQVFQNGEFITYDTISPDFKADFTSGVSGTDMLWQNLNSKYIDLARSASSTWNGLGKISVREVTSGRAVGITDINDDSATFAGRFDYNSQTLIMNDASFGSPQDPLARKVMLHEFGHTVGLGHSCRAALMDANIYYNESVDAAIQPFDRSSYNAIYK